MRYIAIFLFCICAQSQNVIRFHTGKKVPVVMMSINGKMGEFIIDTGASYNYIDYGVKKRYKFKTIKDRGKVIGVGNSDNTVYKAMGITTTYKDTVVNIIFKSLDLSGIRNNKGVIGIIGSEWLGRNGYVIDYRRKLLWRKK